MTATKENRKPAIPRHPLAQVSARENAIREMLVGKHKTETETYTEEDVETLIKSDAIQRIIAIDAELLEKADISKGADAAVSRECEQFKMRLDYLESVLTLEQLRAPAGLRTKPWTLAVVSVKQVAKEFGQTLSVSTDIAAPLWTSADQQTGQTKELRSTFMCGLAAYGVAEGIGFFDESCAFGKPLLVQGFPTVLPNGVHSFTITKFCLDTEQAQAMYKERKVRLEAEAKAKREALKLEKAQQRAEAKALKEKAKAQAKAERAARPKRSAKRGKSPVAK